MFQLGCPFSKHAKQSVSDKYQEALETKGQTDPDPETTTPSGCTCTSYCAATLDGNNFEYDWCYTNDGCGQHSFAYGWWDYCLYLDSSKPDYLALSWRVKQDLLWADIMADNSIDGYPNPAITFAELRTIT